MIVEVPVVPEKSTDPAVAPVTIAFPVAAIVTAFGQAGELQRVVHK